MKLEDIVVSLELAKELKEVGYPQKSLFYWVSYLTKNSISEYKLMDEPNIQWEFERSGEMKIISAPTASELLDRLPRFMNSNGKFHWEISLEEIEEKQFIDGKELVERKTVELFSMMYPYHAVKVQGKTFVEMLAKMWFYLKQNNLINKER